MRFNDILVLNKLWIPVYIVDYKKTMSLIYQEHAHALDRNFQPYDFQSWLDFTRLDAELHSYQKVHTTQVAIALPEIIVLTRYDRLAVRDIKYSRENVFTRDKNKCQYCGKHFNNKDLTIDHIIPKCLGGKSHWSNVVAACKPCNSKKADHLLEKCGMKLLKKPRKPQWFNPLTKFAGKEHPCKSWEKFMDRVEIELNEQL